MKAGLLCTTLVLTIAFGVRAQTSPQGRLIYERSAQSVFLLLVQASNGKFVAQGSGFLIGANEIVTNAHVASAGKVFVNVGQARIQTTDVAIDDANDLAILRVDAELSAPALVLASGSPSPGDPVFVISNPEGLTRTISQGILSGLRVVRGRELLQITAPISPGSSGGPVFDAPGQVIGVAVAQLEEGQNLNFAVPVVALRQLLADKTSASGSVETTLATVQQLIESQKDIPYSDDANSLYAEIQQRIDTLLSRAFEEAGSQPDELLKVSSAAHAQDDDLAIAAARKAIKVIPSAEAELALAYALESKSLLTDTALLRQAESAARASVAARPTAVGYAELGDIVREESNQLDAIDFYLEALKADGKSPDKGLEAQVYRGLSVAYDETGNFDKGTASFNLLVATGESTYWDWLTRGWRLDSLAEAHGGKPEQYRAGAEAYAGAGNAGAGNAGAGYTAWCDAASDYQLAGAPDDVLSAGRKCIEQGTGQRGADSNLALAHDLIAAIFNDRGLYSEALDEAQQATTLQATNAWYFEDMAEALIGLQRYTEAVSAAQTALRLSDGKYGHMHFTLGSAYFNLKNWQLAEQSFKQAAEMDPQDPSPSYNVALCLENLEDYRDAIVWYQEYLQRAPSAPNRDQVLARIAALRNLSGD